jgi:glycosyltransferase involved in cell wall biosynthesis
MMPMAPSVPLVSCLMPTRDHRGFVAQAIAYFQRQDYPRRELVIVDDGRDPVDDLVPVDPSLRYVRLPRPLRLGAKRNLACELARGELLAHWDDDDWYSPHRLSSQVTGLLESTMHLSGSPHLLFFDPVRRNAWIYAQPAGSGQWLSGATLLYTRELWAQNRFRDIAIGEDSLFTSHNPMGSVHVPDDQRLCVGIVHPDNAAPKITTDRGWFEVPVETVTRLLGADEVFYAGFPGAHAGQPFVPHHPLVSCIMPTFERPHFLPRAIGYFQAQDWPNRELVIVDDGRDPVDDLVPDDRRIRYVHVDERRSIGAKRNLACELADGEVIVQWDDDDWYSRTRVTRQVADIIAGRADVTGLNAPWFLEVPTGRFLTCVVDPTKDVLFRGIIGGSLAFRRDIWLRCGGYPDESIAEDIRFLSRAMDQDARLLPLDNAGTMVCVRHPGNTWRFDGGQLSQLEDWASVSPPDFMPEDDLAFYDALRRSLRQSGPAWEPRTMEPA